MCSTGKHTPACHIKNLTVGGHDSELVHIYGHTDTAIKLFHRANTSLCNFQIGSFPGYVHDISCKTDKTGKAVPVYIYLAQLGQIAARPAPCVTSNIPPISCSSLWVIKPPPSFPHPVKSLCARLPAHIISERASKLPGLSCKITAFVITVRSRASAIASVISRFPPLVK